MYGLGAISVPLIFVSRSYGFLSEQAAFRSSKLSSTGIASKLPVANPTASFWTHSTPDANPLARNGSLGPLTSSADVCIIGSGIAGVGTAYHLSQMLSASKEPGDAGDPLNTVIFEARDFCSGATGRNGGHLTPYFFLNFERTASPYGTAEAVRAVDIEKHVLGAIAEVVYTHGWEGDVDFVQGGRVIMAKDESVMARAKRDYELAKTANVNLSVVEWLGPSDMAKLYGASYPGYRTPGSNIWPLKLVTRLFGLAQSSPLINLTLHTHTPVTAIENDASGHWKLSTPRGETSCKKVIHATNAYARHLLPALDITPIRGHVIATRASLSANLSDSAFLLKGKYWFPRPEQDGKGTLIILGGGHTEGTYDDSLMDESIGEDLRAFLPSDFPDKFEQGVEPEMEWTGIMGYTPNEDPYVGPVKDAPGQFVLAGFSGHGMPRAFGCADTIDRMVKGSLDGSGEWDVPSWFPRHYLTSGEGARNM